MKHLAVLLLTVIVSKACFSQSYNPLPVTGFNHDVIAEGVGKNPRNTTSKEMDDLSISNHIMCSRQFARSINMANSGLPDNGIVKSGTKTFALAPYGISGRLSNNALYLLPNERGALTITKPRQLDGISILGLATEGFANVAIVINYSDGTSIRHSMEFPDWFDGANPVLSGFGRVKRVDQRSVGAFEISETNPRMYSFDFPVSADKTVRSIDFRNATPGSGPGSHRAFIFGLAGSYTPPPPVVTTTPARTFPSAVPDVVKDTAKTPVKEVVKIPVKEVVKAPVVNTLHVMGKVKDKSTDAPIEGKLTFVGETEIVATCNRNGDYETDLPLGKEFIVKVEAPGFLGTTGKIIPVQIVSADPTNIRFTYNFSLVPASVGTKVNLKNILFQVTTAVLLVESYPELNLLVDMMKANPSMMIELAGHTDNVGAASLNLKLSITRVEVVKKYLVEKGIESERISGKGYGGTMPLYTGKSAEEHKLNRRVELIVTKL